jgi:ribosomal protein S18 acetylase RimI-like enzyme
VSEKRQDYFLHILGRGHYFAWVATNHVGKVVGYIALRIRNSWTEVQSLAVGSEARGVFLFFPLFLFLSLFFFSLHSFTGLGVGRGLMEQMLRLADAYQTNVKLHVSVFNSPALALYKSLGFSPSKWLMDYYAAEEEDAIEMYLMKR